MSAWHNTKICNSTSEGPSLTGRQKALTMGLCTTWTFQETSNTSGMSLFLCARCCTSLSTTWCWGSVTGTRSSANSSMCWNKDKKDFRKLSRAYLFLIFNFHLHPCIKFHLTWLKVILSQRTTSVCHMHKQTHTQTHHSILPPFVRLSPFLKLLPPAPCSSLCWTPGGGCVPSPGSHPGGLGERGTWSP